MLSKAKSVARKLFFKLGGNVLTYNLIRRSLNELSHPMQNRASIINGVCMPPPRLIFMVAGHYNPTRFYTQGRDGLRCIENLLEKNGLRLERFSNILDFGCGCGRFLTHLAKLKYSNVFGCDYNPILVSWSQKNYSFATITQNKPASPLNYQNRFFDLVYVISVFTHLPKNLQDYWVKELHRVIKPNGYLIVSLHGSGCIKDFSDQQKEAFNSGKLVVVDSKYAGTNVCGSYHPEQYVRKWTCEFFEIEEYAPCGLSNYQDLYLLRRL